MEKRHGQSISVKMILTSAALIAVIVLGFGFLNIYNIQNVYEETTADTELQLREQLKVVGGATVETLAASSRTYYEQSNDQDLKNYVAQLAKGDEKISFIYVLNTDHRLVAHSSPEKQPAEGHAENNEESWQSIMSEWKARQNDPKQSPLIAAKEFVGKEGKLALFATPVFPASAVPTVKAAIDPAAEVKPYYYVVTAYTFKYLQQALEALQDKKEAAIRQAWVNTGVIGILFVLIGSVLAIFQGLRISKPIKMLAWKADQIARGDLETRVEVTSNDEIGLLGENFNYMADQLIVLLKQTAEKATMEKELEVARTIQETLVPSNDVVDYKFIKLAGYFQPASQCGGDWWSHHTLVGDKVLVVIGDVTGHGVPSAMITAAAKASCDVARAVFNNDLDPTQLLEIMNGAIYESAKRKFVMTCFASVLDPKAKTITYANAGHNFPYLYRTKGGKGEFGSLMTRGNRLGDLPESKYVAKTTELEPGDVLVWYTDGIVECENEAGEEFGEKRFRSAIRRAAAMDPAELRNHIVTSSNEFFGEKPRKDDITMVIARLY